MMKAESIRNLAVGLLLGTGICGAVYFINPSETEPKVVEKEVTVSEDEMISSLTSNGYMVLTNEELEAQIAEAQAAVEQNTEPEGNVVYRTMISVSTGMTSIDVGKALVGANIIDNALKFSQAVEAKGVEKDLRPGTFEVQSDMTQDELIAKIFKK